MVTSVDAPFLTPFSLFDIFLDDIRIQHLAFNGHNGLVAGQHIAQDTGELLGFVFGAHGNPEPIISDLFNYVYATESVPLIGAVTDFVQDIFGSVGGPK